MGSRYLTATVSILAAVAGIAQPARAATIPVTTLADAVSAADGLCSLREAVLAVSTPPGSGDCVRAEANANTISLGPGKHFLTRVGAGEDAGSTGDLDIDGGTVTLTISGTGAGATTIDAAGLGDRLVDVAAGAPSVAIRDLTLTGGRAPAGTNSTAGVAGTAGASGGAIRSFAALSFTDVNLSDNQAGAGGAGGQGPTTGGVAQPGAVGGAGGSGGAIEITGSLSLTRVTLSFNFAGDGGDGGSGSMGGSGQGSGAAGGVGGVGGAISSLGGPATLTGVRFNGNGAGDGGKGGRGAEATSSSTAGDAGVGGAGGRGGALLAAGSPVIVDSTFTANAAGNGGAGGTGGSGGISNAPRAGGIGGSGANGGAILIQGDATLLNVTLVANRAGAGGTGGGGGAGSSSVVNGAPGGAGGAGGLGGGLRRQQAGTAGVAHATIAGNFAGTGGAGGPGGGRGSGSGSDGQAGATGVAGTGAGISEASLVNAYFTTLANSIVASNQTSNCSTGVVDEGHNIAFGDASCPFTAVDPKLGPLQDNGGPVETRAPLPGSPARDQVPAVGADCAAADARRVPRPSPAGGLCDIGAVEISPPECQPASAAVVAGQSTQIDLRCTDVAGAPFTFALLSQPAHGTLSAFGTTTGRVTYTAAAGYTGPDSFSFQGTTADGSDSAPAALTVVASGSGPAPGAAPLLSALRVSPSRFRAARRGASVAAARIGTRVTFTLDRPASARFTVARRVVGRRSGSRCVARTRRNRRAKRCVRLVAVRGSFTRAGSAGANAFRFTGRMRGRRLTPGRYVLRARPTAAGVSGKTARVAFKIVR